MKIKTHNKEIDDFNGLLLIDVKNTSEYLKRLYMYEKQHETSVFEINNVDIDITDCLIITPFSKYSDLISYTSKNIFTKLVGNINFDQDKILNEEYINKEVVNKLNETLGRNIVSLDTSYSKILKSIINISDDYIDHEFIYSYLELLHWSKEIKTVILKDFDNIDLKRLSNLTQTTNLIIMKNDIIYDLEKHFEFFETYCLVDHDYENLIKIDNMPSFEYLLEDIFKVMVDDEFKAKMSFHQLEIVKKELKKYI
ncbi:hypothetical protein, partial [[Mycoplasma] imitans]|uniref:hypothetical protein n=1 Tax=[Mycoplasma] imitans TaxID=29560 RepID=UPI00055DBF52